MPVTEIATLQLTHPLNKSLIEKLKTAEDLQQRNSGFPLRCFQQIDDPTFIYLIGKWNSPEAHYAWLPTPQNQGLLESLQNDVAMDKITMWHISKDVFEVEEGKKWVFDAPVVRFERHFVAENRVIGYKWAVDDVGGLLDDFTKPYGVPGGWRIEKESEEQEEWVLFSGFESVEDHQRFSETDTLTKCKGFISFVEGHEVKLLRAIEGL